MLLCMATASRPDAFPGDTLDEYPPEIRTAFRRWGRAVAALRVYRRRGWNASAVLAQVERERAAALRLLDEHQDRLDNPVLF